MQTNLLLNEAESTLFDSFDWYSIISKVCTYCFFEKSKTDVRNTHSLPKELIQDSLSRQDVLIERLDQFRNHYYSNTTHLDPRIESYDSFLTFEKGRAGDLDSLNYITLHFEMFLSMFKTFKELALISEEQFNPKMMNLFRKQFISEFRAVINTDGTINYGSHPVLKGLHRELQRIESIIRETLSKLPRTTLFEKALQYPEYDIIYDHFVLAVKSDSYNANMGQIVARSSSGHTLLIEPVQIKDLGNQRLQVNAKIEEFLNTIFQSISNFIFENFTHVSTFIHANIDFDIDLAKARFGSQDGFSKPQLEDDFPISLKNFFNPLIPNPVKNDLELKVGDRGLLISGPNTGGKSVVLKSVTLAFMFLHQGMYVPAEQANLPLLDGLFFLSSDLQDINEGLSSFSSEVKTYLDLLESINGKSLIVIDEIFNSTSSEEASVLAAALIDYMSNREDIKLIVSTHHKKLKNYIYENKKLISAHMGFDKADHTPTYTLFIGEPGSSYALSIFQTIGRGRSITSQILGLVDDYNEGGEVKVESMLEDIAHKNQQLDLERKEIKRQMIDLQNRTKAFEASVESKRADILDNFERKLKKQILKAEALYDSVKRGEIQGKKTLYREISEINQTFRTDKNDRPIIDESMKGEMVDESHIEVGADLYCTLMNKTAKVSQLNPGKKKALMSSGMMKIWAPYDTLFTSKQKSEQGPVKISVDRTVRGEIVLDARGMRLEEFQKRVVESLIELESGDIPFLDIIHGHGEGILKKWLRDHLKSRKDDYEWAPEEGNDGVTKVKLT
jgi:DNA mismatch repair protein MutS2